MWHCPSPFQLFNTKSVAQDSHQGIFKTHQELDTYESMWHTNIYQPSWRELQTNVSSSGMLGDPSMYAISKTDVYKLWIFFHFTQYSSTWLNEHFMKIRLGHCQFLHLTPKLFL